MKQTLLSLIFGLFLIAGYAQLGPASHANNQQKEKESFSEVVSIFPNPATHFIGLTNYDENIEQIHVYNILGRRMKTFEVSDDQRYYIADLNKGIYLVQLIDPEGKIVRTQRMSKR